MLRLDGTELRSTPVMSIGPEFGILRARGVRISVLSKANTVSNLKNNFNFLI